MLFRQTKKFLDHLVAAQCRYILRLSNTTRLHTVGLQPKISTHYDQTPYNTYRIANVFLSSPETLTNDV